MAKSFRMFPSLTLEEAVAKLKVVYESVGKGPSSKEAYVKGLGYKGLSGASNRVFGALAHYGFIEKAGHDYKISELGMHVVLPDNEDDATKYGYLRQAAVRPSLFRDIYEKYMGEKLPTMLHNTLVHDFRVYDRSGKEAAENFKQTLEYAGLLQDGVITDQLAPASDSSKESEAAVAPPAPANQAFSAGDASIDAQPSEMTNRIEIVLREGVKAGIYAPYNLTQPEKDKLKSIIELL